MAPALSLSGQFLVTNPSMRDRLHFSVSSRAREQLANCWASCCLAASNALPLAVAADSIGLYFQGSSVDQVLPLKYKWITESAGANTTGAGSLTFNLLNQRQNLVFRSGSSKLYPVLATSHRASTLRMDDEAAMGTVVPAGLVLLAVATTGCSC